MKWILPCSIPVFLLSFPWFSCCALDNYFDQAEIKDPTASFINVAARRDELASATNPRVLEALKDRHGCANSDLPAPPEGRIFVPSHYLNGSYGPTNPDENKAIAVYISFENSVSRGASRYLATGDHLEAASVASLLSRWAKADSLLHYSLKEGKQAWYQVEWTIASVSLAYSVVQNDTAITPEQRKLILEWMHRVVVNMLDQNLNADPAKENNHAYSRALGATSVGILTNDHALYRRGLEQYPRALAQMNADGSLPLEMARHENALSYQSFALQPLSMIAELASRQGLDLYALRVNGHCFKDGVDFLVKASGDLSIMKQYAAEPQSFSLFSGKRLPAWLEFWARRFPGKPWDELLTSPSFDVRVGGNTTLYSAPAKASQH